MLNVNRWLGHVGGDKGEGCMARLVGMESRIKRINRHKREIVIET
jgi:hypothetical protein